MLQNNSFALFQSQDIQISLAQYLAVPDIIQHYRLISKETNEIMDNSGLWPLLLKRDFKIDMRPFGFQDKQACFLLYKAFYLETKFHFQQAIAPHLALYEKAIQDLMPLLTIQAWKDYFDLSLTLHQWAHTHSYKTNLEEKLKKLLAEANGQVIERLCWLVAARYWLFNSQQDNAVFGIVKKLEDLAKQSNNQIYDIRSDMLYAVYLIKHKEHEHHEDGYESYDSDDEEIFPIKDLYKAVYLAIKTKEENFYPIVARLLFRSSFDSWTFFRNTCYKEVIKQLHKDLTEEITPKPALNSFLINLYTELAKTYEPFRAIIFPHLHKAIKQNNGNLFYIHDYKACRKNLLDIMEEYPKLFSFSILSATQEKLKDFMALPQKKLAKDKESLKSLLEEIEKFNDQQETLITQMDKQRGMGGAALLRQLQHSRLSYRSDDEETDYDSSEEHDNVDLSNNYLSFFNQTPLAIYQNLLRVREEVKAYENARDNILKPNFNQAKVIQYINQAFGEKFVKAYIDTRKANWQVTETKKNEFCAKLEGVLITKKSDCEWYRSKLMQAGVQEKHIHFDVVKTAKDAPDKYQINITQLQTIKVTLNPAATSSNQAEYQQFIEEMDTQIENIKTAQQLLQLEQNGMIQQGRGSCLRALQNNTKLKNHEKLIKLFEEAKSTANPADYKTKRQDAYQKAEQLGYRKTESKQDAAMAYYMRTWS